MLDGSATGLLLELLGLKGESSSSMPGKSVVYALVARIASGIWSSLPS